MLLTLWPFANRFVHYSAHYVYGPSGHREVNGSYFDAIGLLQRNEADMLFIPMEVTGFNPNYEIPFQVGPVIYESVDELISLNEISDENIVAQDLLETTLDMGIDILLSFLFAVLIL